ncbi:MAG: lyase family protein [Blastocatellia bacterium]
MIRPAARHYGFLHPNDHVNHSQSERHDAFRNTHCCFTSERTPERYAFRTGNNTCADKSREFADVRKSGRASACGADVGRGVWCICRHSGTRNERLRMAQRALIELPLGGTAIGNGVNTNPDYTRLVIERLAHHTGLPLRAAPNRFAATQSLNDLVALSGALRGIAVELTKIANDIRLLSSGPNTGLNEIELPAVQPGSSIMPGKVNPALAEMLNMVCYHVLGQDAAIAQCGAAGQLELNVMMPYVAYALLESLDVLAHAVRSFTEKCVRGIQAHRERCAMYAERTVGLAALHNQELGFMEAAKLAQRAMDTGQSVQEVLKQPGS